MFNRNSIKSIKNSLLVTSANLKNQGKFNNILLFLILMRALNNFNSPKITLLYNHKEYIALKTMLVAANIPTLKLKLAIDIKTRISPIKLLVPGKPKLLSVNDKNNNEKIGIKLIKPP